MGLIDAARTDAGTLLATGMGPNAKLNGSD
jgi:hypothetical protein